MMDFLSYPFMVRALIAGVLLSASAALVGVPLVLKKNSMIGDGLSHTAFSVMAVALVLGLAPTAVALPVVMLVSFIVLRISKSRHLHGDAAVALLSAASLAIGTLAISVSSGVNIDLNSYLFGSILSVNTGDVWLAAGLAIVTVLLYLFSYHRILALSFDEEFSRAIGIRAGLYDAILSLLCSAVVVLGLRLLGALLISSLIIFPAISAMQVAKSFKGVVILSVIISVLAFLIGLLLSYFLSLPTGATVVIINLLILISLWLASKIRKL